jgi:RNA polymerase sigma-70 factor (ECF subfamily)
MRHSVVALVADRHVDDVVVPPAFDSFYRLEFPRLVDLAYALSGSRMAAEDLVQEAMIAAHRDWARVGVLDKPGAWVRRVVLNLSASHYYRRLAEIRALRRLAWLRGEPPAQLDPDSAEFWNTLRKLPKRQTEAVALHYLDGYSVTEIAEVMGCAESTVKVHLHRARKSLSLLLSLEEDQ